mgnify:CR=1 FL=1
MKKLVLVLLLSISFISYADSTCTWQYGNTYKCKEDRRFEGPDMVKAGIGLRNILRWLNENSTNNSNSENIVPQNAYKSGNIWKCNAGYKALNGSCIKTQTNISSTNCSKGFKKVGSSCVYIKIPANAYASGNSWKCLSGYTKSGSRCIDAYKKTSIPKNAYAYGTTWLCRAGYKLEGANRCVDDYKETSIPANAIGSISSWSCKKGYQPWNAGCRRIR